MPGLFSRLEGHKGFIDIPFLGAHIGDIINWTLVRRSDRGSESELYDLTAVCSFVNDAMFNDPDYTKRVVVKGGRGHPARYRLDQVPGQLTELHGRQLRMERVKLCRLQEDEV